MSIGSSSLPYLRVRVVPRFPARVEGASGIEVDKTNGVFTVKPATGTLMEVATVSASSFVQVWNAQTDSYVRTPSTAFVGGDGMAASVYDPNGVEADVFSMENMVETSTAKVMTGDERTKLAGIATGATANVGTVTSVALALPTGFSVSGSPISGSGTLTGVWASGYRAYTDAEATKLSGIASGATANTGTVTSVAMTVPTGLSISGSAITTSGTLGLTWTSGYQSYTTAEAGKLSGIATGATANDTDANLKNRANHTGTQAASTITGLAAVATSGTYSSLSGLPTLGTVAALSYPGGTTTFLRADGTFATPPGGGGGGGDMYAAVYDPNGVADDAFDMDNMAEGTTAKIFTATERSKLTAIEANADVTDATNVAAAGAFMKSVDTSDAITAGTTNLFMTPAERSKLAGVASGATANTGTVTSVAVAVPSSMTTSGGPLTTSGTITLGHASGYQGYTSAEASKLAGIATGATANTGTVTSVQIAVPTGFTVSGGPLTTSGTITMAFASGYQGYTTTEASKLSGIASGATANSSDATLLNRANHTGTQAISTVASLQTALDAKVAKSGDSLTGGFTATAVDDGIKTVGNTYALTPVGGNFRKATANGAFSIAAPTVAGCYNMTVDLTNGASAGAITFTGFIAGYPKGDAYTTTNGHKFKLHISKSDVGVTAMLEALQ